MKSKRKEEKDIIMTELKYIDVSQIITLCTLDTIVRIDEEAGNLYNCKKCIFKDTVIHDVSVCPYRRKIQKLLR